MDHALWQDLGVSETGLARLRQFTEVVARWTQRINLVSRNTLETMWERHVEDSARLLCHAPADPVIWADFGAGGGFPGLVVALIRQDRGDDVPVILVESDQRKAAFLREAARMLSLKVDVRATRAEGLAPLSADVVSARALAPLVDLCAIMERHCRPDGVALFPKGAQWRDEVAQAHEKWRFVLDAHLDPGNKGGAILELRNLQRASREDTAGT